MPYLKLNQAFGKVLSRLRRERELSQEVLGFESDLARNYISMLERGERSPSLTTISQLSEPLGVLPEHIVKLTFEELERLKT